MICLGVYGLRSAFRKRRELQGGIPFVADPEATAEQVLPESYLEIDTPSYRDDAPTPAADYSNSSSQEELPVEASQNVADLDSYQSITGVAPEPIPSNAGRWQHRCSTKTLALFAGIIHGLAGPGGVLGIIPAVQLHNWKLAICYLGSFCISSTITMGVFACTYGTISSFLGYHKNLDFEIQCFSATLSLIVGILWLVLISIGKLDDIFP
ncbi:hypothetical protein IV203_005683 [Nitzschia inconspicua]|uniref:Uncharacterized protein n=1 Tax=Nitzschia inconspicua TaxID=303405 RepID=A0A9K3KNV2_9STRA|nr:hypothetical protein IV203_005683 [Nitzschia inconspicua]